MSTIAYLTEKGLAHPPRWLPTNTHYETIMGSVAYGVSADTSDMDVYGFAIPNKDEVFPHLRGEVLGFGRQIKRFDQYQEHHIQDRDAMAGHGRVYDITIYNIVRYFMLAMENNPNIVDSLFTKQTCVLHCTEIGNMVRDARKKFLHKGCWPKFKGYAYSQLHKIHIKNPMEGKRQELVETYGYDTKFAYHVVRLLLEAEMILMEGNIDLERHNEQMKSVRRGEWTEEELKQWASNKEVQLENYYHKSTLPSGPDEPYIKNLLLNCLEHHFGSLSDCIVNVDAAVVALRGVQAELDKVRHLL